MTLPFSVDQFLDVFAAYNRALWPIALGLWAASVAAVVLLLRHHPRASRIISVVLVVLWGWAGVAYHFVFFRRINPAALLFAVLFVTQAGLFLIWSRRVTVDALQLRWSAWSYVGLVLLLYALVYPALGFAFGLTYPRAPTFGVPCPTTLFTIGALLIARQSVPRWLCVIPLGWTIVGGSAAFLLGVHADLALILSGGVLLLSLMLPRTPIRSQVAPEITRHASLGGDRA